MVVRMYIPIRQPSEAQKMLRALRRPIKQGLVQPICLKVEISDNPGLCRLG